MGDEFWVGIAIVTMGFTAFFLTLQIRQLKKTTSADISLKMIETIRRNEFRSILKKISEKKSRTLNKNEIHRILNHYEYLAEFEKDKILDFDHVLHQHGANIKMLYDDEYVKQIFDESRAKNPDFTYTNLSNLFIKVNHCID